MSIKQLLDTNFLFFSLSDLIQILIGLVGFCLTLVQVSKIKNSHAAAESASAATYKKIVQKLNSESIAKINFGLQDLFNSIRNGSYEWSLLRLQSVVQDISEFQKREDFIPKESLEIIRNNIDILTKIQITLSTALCQNKRPKTPEILRQIGEVIQSSHSWVGNSIQEIDKEEK